MGDYSDEPEDLPSYCAVSAAGDINLAIEEYASPCEEDRGLMYWYHNEGNGVDDKVYSARMDVEVYKGELAGVITAKIVGELTDDEMRTFKDYITGQLSDGAGEVFEQRPISTSGGDILVSFWNGDNDCCDFDNGRSLGVLWGVDNFTVIGQEEAPAMDEGMDMM